ncbi:MAG: DUF5009 domain-containing protein [Bacteroidota bacterium]
MKKTIRTTKSNRIRTIDVLRALTMFFMIFVNDLFTLTGVPKWLEHTATHEDGMGFSDVIFPLFLFIVGLSIPLAINIRIKKGESPLQILGHILVRTIALLVMGFYMVNYESINEEALGFSKRVWLILMASAIFLIWMDYRRLPRLHRMVVWALKSLGLLLLGYLAWAYRGGIAENIVGMKPYWWGILGLIGWAYLLNGLLYLLFQKRVAFLVIAFVLLLFMNIQENGFFEILPGFKLVVSASNHVLVMAGVLCTIFFLRFREPGQVLNRFLALVLLTGLVLVVFGFLIRPYFPISKNLATPSWTVLCIGIGLWTFVILYGIVDRLGYVGWASPIRSAGTSTLTCYLMPYFIYPALALLGLQLPDFLLHGSVGLLKSLLFSLAIVLFVGMLERRNIRLRV